MPIWPAPGNYLGADITVTGSTLAGGTYTNVGIFTIPAGVTLTVTPYNGSAGGFANIYARKIIYNGSISASASGYGGGAGGGGGGGGAENLAGTGGASIGGFQGGGAGSAGANCPGAGTDSFGGPGGNGGDGAGPYPGSLGAGAGGQSEAAGHPGTNNGGYQSTGGTGDSSINDDVFMGSGGGGGGGGVGGGTHIHGAGAGGAGGAGGPGGGIIRLIASTIIIRGSLLSIGTADGANGTVGGNTTGGYIGGHGGDAVNGRGGSCSPGGGGSGTGDSPIPGWSQNGFAGGAGTGGAGGGILIKFVNRLAQISAMPRVYVKGTINNTGSASTTNGGTVKIFSPKYLSTGTITSGRTYVSTKSVFGTMAG